MTLNLSDQISPDLVLQPVSDAEITCRWCKKLAAVCDGQITLGEALKRLHLPLSTGQRLARRSLHEHWLEPVGAIPGAQAAGIVLGQFRADLSSVLGQAGGIAAGALMAQASGMIRLEKEWLSPEDITSYLLAVELLLPAEARDQLLPLLDALKLRYAG